MEQALARGRIVIVNLARGAIGDAPALMGLDVLAPSAIMATPLLTRALSTRECVGVGGRNPVALQRAHLREKRGASNYDEVR